VEDADRPPTERRTTVAEAAGLLGISAEAVRGRIRRGTLPVEREGGAVYVLLDRGIRDRPTADQSRTDHDRPGDRTELVGELRNRIGSLERQLEEANTRDREQRRIIAGLTQRIPAIEAPTEAPGPPEAATASGGGGDVPSEPQAATSREPWYRRWFG